MLAHLILGAAWLLAPPPHFSEPKLSEPEPSKLELSEPGSAKPELAGADSAVRVLRSSPLATEDLWLVWHDRSDWAMAFYLPPAPLEDGPALEWTGIEPEHQRLMAIPAPRLMVYGRYFGNPDASQSSTDPEGTAHEIAIGPLAVDSGEYLFKALIDAHFDLRLSPQERGGRVRRASVLFQDLPPEGREGAYFGILAEFGAHLLSLRNEIDRTFKRHGADGRAGLCALAGRSLGLFALWRRAFISQEFRGQAEATQDGAIWNRRRLQFSAAGLESQDKGWFVEQILGRRWTGDPETDFQSYCNSSVH